MTVSDPSLKFIFWWRRNADADVNEIEEEEEKYDVDKDDDNSDNDKNEVLDWGGRQVE
jgi:hypothetical protein